MNIKQSKISKLSSKEANGYHHGDLRASLLTKATELIAKDGIDQLSLRKLATQAGVSRTAPYHHFKDKNDLLCAVAEVGFKKRLQNNRANFGNETLPMKERFSEYIHDYITFAGNNPELYELMFGRTIWKQNKSTEELKASAYPCFQHQVEMTARWQELGLLDKQENTLRLSQVIWGTLHGIAKLYIDGIYTDTSQVEEICQCAVNVFINKL